MIPKIVHYCWFGPNPYPEKVRHCMNSWKIKLPNYEFVLWNESNFDVSKFEFTKQAYEDNNFAFVSDFVRMYALVEYGGFYFDTDFEVVKSLDDFVDHRVVLGTDDEGYLDAFLGAEKGHPFFVKVLESFKTRNYLHNGGGKDLMVVNTLLQNTLIHWGYQIENKKQILAEGIVVYPDDYFNVISLLTGKINKTDNTYIIHWHTLLWVPFYTRIIRFIRLKILIPLLGENNYKKIQRLK